MSLRTRMRRSPRLSRLVFNLWPCIRGTGSRVTYIARDWSEIRVRLPLSWRTRNYVGSIFGGSLYAAVDPYYMLMFIERLGSEYVVWDKAASIRFRRPGRSTLTATFTVDDAEVAAVRAAVAEGGGAVDRTYRVELVDASGEVHAIVEKVLYVATRDADAARRAGRT
jgi:acyl-coenzyme A thioesterase PaaI-like protein